jgi:hypothetical protein
MLRGWWRNMTKHVCDEELERRSNALYEVFIRIPYSDDHEPSIHTQQFTHRYAISLARLSMTGDTSRFMVDGMNRKREREKLYEVRKLARRLSLAMRELDPNVIWALTLSSSGTSYFEATRVPSDQAPSDRPDYSESLSTSDDDEDFWYRFWPTLTKLDHELDKALPETNVWIDNALEMGKRERHKHIIVIVDYLCDFWESRTGDAPPNFLNEDTRFGKFLASAFKAMKLENNPRAAMDSWRKYRASAPKSE